ncbi:MAG TPA: GNAT family N-acetyltransferase [Acetobacteraceae bacterium]|nr:GNAT family N-acetyltransferase [Acetobacteraceae bacterium]
MNPPWAIRTGRLDLTPVGWQDMPDLCALKGDPLVYAAMLGGVRGPVQVAAELAEDTAFWARHGVGMWMVRENGAAIGLTGLHERPDGRGIGLRFALRPETRGRGLAREAAGAALRFAHDRARLGRVVAVARESNVASRTVLGAIGMRECDAFLRDGERMLVYESLG